MASLTFAEAKVVAPPILPRKHSANTDAILDPVMTQYDAILDHIPQKSIMMSHHHKLFPHLQS